MKFLKTILAICCSLVLVCSCGQDKTPKAKHVVLIGFDAMSACGMQKAETPNFNYMIDNGAVSIKTRCVRSTSSSHNWMSMVSGALPEMHGVTSNAWELDNREIPAAVSDNGKNTFPTIFELVKKQRPDAKVYMYYEWTEQDRMYDISLVDRAVTGLENGTAIITEAFNAFFEDKPEFLFISINEPDEVGHDSGHESNLYYETITRYDALVGDFVRRVEEAGMLDETVIIVTADHGGQGNGHGGDTAAEREVPIILYGGDVTKGKLLEHTNHICDIAATVGGLLGVELPRETAGKFIEEAFEPKTDKVYVPMPLVIPYNGFVLGGQEKVVIRGDVEGAEVYYTLDGTTPTDKSIRYDGPFDLKQSATVKAVVYRNGQHGQVFESQVRVVPEGDLPKIAYKFYDNHMLETLPDFNRLGTPARSGYVHEFSLSEFNVDKEDHFAILMTTEMLFDETGEYRFGIVSDDGSKLFIDGKLVIDNDGSHSSDIKYGSVKLTKGWHDVRVEYFDDYMGQRLEVYYSSDNIPAQRLPFEKFRR